MTFEGGEQVQISYKGRWERVGGRVSNNGYVYIEERNTRTGKTRTRRLRGRIETKKCPRCRRNAGSVASMCNSCGFDFNIQNL